MTRTPQGGGWGVGVGGCLDLFLFFHTLSSFAKPTHTHTHTQRLILLSGHHQGTHLHSNYRNFRTISRDFFSQLWTLRLKQRMRLIYGFFSIQGASHPRLFLASFQLASKRGAAIQTCLCSVLFISKVSQKFVSIFKHSVEWSIHNNF